MPPSAQFFNFDKKKAPEEFRHPGSMKNSKPKMAQHTLLPHTDTPTHQITKSLA